MTEDQIDYCEFWVTAHYKVKEREQHNADGIQIQVNNRLNFDYLEKELQDYPDREVIKYFKYGWPLNANNTVKDESIPPN